MPRRAAGARTETGTGPVRGYLANQSGTGTKTDTPLRETPQSITVVTADRVTDQGALTVQEALRYVPGVFADAYGLDSRGDYPRIRGQDPNIYLDGTRVVNTFTFNEWRPDPYTLERIEVLRGPASVLYGDTSTAGLLNLVSKRPQAEAFNEIGVQFGSFNRKQVQMDSTGKLTKDGEWLYRFIGVFRDSGMQTDFVPDNRILLAPSLTWRPTNNTNWTVLGTYQKDTTGSSTAFLPHEGTLYPGPNGLIPVRRFAGVPGFDKYQTETGAVSSLFEHSFGDALKIRQNMRYAHVEGIYRTAYPNVYGDFSDPPNQNFPFLDPSQRTVERFISSRETSKDSFTSDSNVELKLSPGRCPQGAGRRRLPRPQRARAIRLRLRHYALRSLRTGLYRRDPSGAFARGWIFGRPSSGSMRRTRCGSDRGWQFSASARISSPTTCGGAGGGYQGDHRPRRADVRIAVRSDALRHLCAVVHADLRLGRLRRRLQGAAG